MTMTEGDDLRSEVEEYFLAANYRSGRELEMELLREGGYSIIERSGEGHGPHLARRERQAMKLYLTGESFRDMAAEWGCSHMSIYRTVVRVCKKYGINRKEMNRCRG